MALIHFINMPSSERVVLFADMLGFSDLIEKYPIDLDEMKAKSRPLSAENISYIFDGFPELFNPKTFPLSRTPAKLKKPENRLSKIFVDFHKSIKWAIEMAKMQYPITAITFSDSLYISTQDLYVTVKIAVDLVHLLMRSEIPIRIGIAHGSFASLNFSSDISLDGGEHSSQFLGTAVVRAHEAESCGIKGIRILLHPSIIPQLKSRSCDPDCKNESHKIFKLIECSKKEQENKANIRYEINYWKFPTKKDAKDSWIGFQEMWNHAPEIALNHYIATAEAIDRMRIAYGEKPLNNLRRRTLPHRAK
jgi:hypothetical protein